MARSTPWTRSFGWCPKLRVLALDTSSEQGSLALWDGDHLVEEVALLAPDGFAQLLFPAIQNLLQRSAFTLPQIDLFAAASGPGSFTGVRVGLAAIKGLAEATLRPAQAISNLRAIAALGTGFLRMPLINARRGEAYVGLYASDTRMLEAERVGPLDFLLSGLPPHVELIARESWPELAATGAVVRIDGRPLASLVARLAMRDGGLDPASLDANYVRRSDADGRWHDTGSFLGA